MGSRFDEIIDRKNTDSLKYDFTAKMGMPEDILPLWVADMDFKTPDCVIDALVQKSRHGIFGYSECDCGYTDTLKKWFNDSFGWEVKENWIVKTPGVVFAICTAIRALTKEGDGVLIQQPVYYPFANSILANGRKLSINELKYSEGRYFIDYEDFENKIINDNVKLFILCSPHNPVGRVWRAEELIRMGDICVRHGVTIVSDEIHMDFVYPGHRHIVFASLKPEFLHNTVTCTAPSKTFNLAGLQVSNIFIANSDMKKIFVNEMWKSGYSQLNVVGLTACRAAYSGGGQWLAELIEYLSGNLDYLRNFVRDRMPRVCLVEPEGTYLVWLDFRELNLSDEQLDDFIVHKAGLWLDGGTMFGKGGEGFQRINIACPRTVLEKALTQLEQALKSI